MAACGLQGASAVCAELCASAPIVICGRPVGTPCSRSRTHDLTRPARQPCDHRSDIHRQGGTLVKSPGAEAFYAEALQELTRLGLPFLLAGTYALTAYTGITRPTKDPRRLLQGRRLPARPLAFPEPRLCGRDRGRALARQGLQGQVLLRRDLRLLERHHAGRGRVVRATRGRSRSSAPRCLSSARPSWSGPNASSSSAIVTTAPTWRTRFSRPTTRSIGIVFSATWRCTGRCC